jgi:ATP-dependent DNA helicase HFM1/MER3
MFPPPKADKPASSRQIDHAPNMSKRRSESGKSTVKASKVTDEFGDDDINDDELVKAAIHDLDFVHIDNYANPIDALTRDNTAKNGTAKKKSHVKPVELSLHDEDPDPKQLDNGRWACNHACKNKLACKHMCCKDGMDKPPKKTGPKRLPTNENRAQAASNAVEVPKSTQTKLQLSSSKRKISAAIEELDLTQDEEKKKTYHANGGRKQYQDMHERSQSVQTHPSSISSIMHKKPKYCYGEGGDYNLSFMNDRLGSGSSDYSEIHFDDLPDDLTRPTRGQTPPVVSSVVHEAEHSVRMISPAADAALDRRSDTFGDDESIFGDAMIGLADSEDLRSDGNRQDVDDDGMKAFENASENDYAFDLPDDEYPIDFDEFPTANNVHAAAVQQVRAGSTIDVPMMPMRRGPSPSFRGTGGGPRSAQHTAKSISKGSILNESNNVHKHTKPSHHRMSSKMTENNKMVDINYDELFTDDAISLEDITAQEKPPTPEAYKGLEPWLFQEFGDIVEIVDD